MLRHSQQNYLCKINHLCMLISLRRLLIMKRGMEWDTQCLRWEYMVSNSNSTFNPSNTKMTPLWEVKTSGGTLFSDKREIFLLVSSTQIMKNLKMRDLGLKRALCRLISVAEEVKWENQFQILNLLPLIWHHTQDHRHKHLDIVIIFHS